MDERIQRLAQRMISLMDDYERDSITLSRLANELDVTIATIGQFSTDDWPEELRQAWGPIEVANAVMLDEGRDLLSPDERRSVEDAIAELRAMLIEY